VLTATGVLVDRFRVHLVSERGLVPNGTDSYIAAVLPFLAPLTHVWVSVEGSPWA
jgi:hypothetical protein